MLLVSEYDSALEIEKKLPPSLVKKLYLTEGSTPYLDMKPTMFGNPIHFVYLGYNLRSAENFVKSLKGDTSNVILISPISRWGLYNVKFKGVEDLRISNQYDTRESKIDLVMKLTGLSNRDTVKALSILKYDFALIEKNLDLLRWCKATNSDIETALSSVEYYSYTDILFYLAGSPKHSKEKFLRTLAKYRNGRKHILKYLKNTLDSFIEYKFEGKQPSKDSQYTVSRLERFLYLEDAMRLRYALDNVSHLSDLLKGEIYK